MATGRGWAALIRQIAPKYGVDPAAALAVASVEGLSGGVGDGGHAFGPFQLNDAGGVLTGRPGNHRAFAESPEGIRWALQRIGSVAGGLKGQDAVDAIVRKFERPAAPDAEVQKAFGRLGGKNLGAAWGGSTSPPGGAPPTGLWGNGNSLRQLIAAQMSQQASNTIAGHVGQDPNTLMQLAMMRQQLGAAQDTFGAVPGGPQPHYGKVSNTPDQHGGWAGHTLDGNTPMVLGGKSPYSNLRFAGHVDWQHTNPRLLRAINSVAASSGKVVDITSGYRSNDYSAKVGGFAGDPHSKGLAVDAYINGQPINSIFGPNVWKHYGVRSGATFVYKGKPDLEHLDLMGT